MIVGLRNSSRRPLRIVVVASAAGILLTACAGQSGSGGSAASGSSSSSSAAASSSAPGARQSPLSKGLLPASAFPQATVVSTTLQQFKQATAGQLGAVSGLQVTPPQCASALQSTQPDVDAVQDLVAQTATQQGSATIEAIMTGGSVSAAVDKLKAAMSGCPTITLTAPQLGTATLSFTPLDVSRVTDQAAAAQYTLTITQPDKAPVTVPALIAVAQDHDRLLLLTTAAATAASTAGAPPPAAPDTNAFTALFDRAYSAEKKALN